MVVAFEQRRLPFLRSSADLSVPKDETSSPPQGSPWVLPCRWISSSNDMAASLASFTCQLLMPASYCLPPADVTAGAGAGAGDSPGDSAAVIGWKSLRIHRLATAASATHAGLPAP